MKLITTLIIVTLLATACTTTNKHHLVGISPAKAIELSAAAETNSIDGVFELTVKAGDYKQSLEFLHSEIDSKDQRNLVVALRPRATQEFMNLYAVMPSDYFVGKKIKVSGEAKRVKYWSKYKGKNIKQYYYQTQIFVTSANQVTIL